jgi:hypothetical protein
LVNARGFRDDPTFEAAEHGLVELPVTVWEGWVFGHALHELGSDRVPSFADHLGDLGPLVTPYACGTLVLADRHSYEVAANWKVIAENYHECYHCPLIHPQLCEVSPPDSGDNYDLPGAWVGGSMELRDGMATMSTTGALAATPLPGVRPTHVEYLHLLPNLFVSAHPDYVMTHRMLPLAPAAPGSSAPGWWRRVPTGPVPDAAGRGRVLGRHEPAGLGGLRVGAARAREPALPAGPVRAPGGRRRRPGDPDRPGLPGGRVRVVTRQRGRCSVQVRWETCCSPSYAVASIATS